MASHSGDNNNNTVTLRVIILTQGNRTQDDLFLALPLTTTVQSLKERIQTDLSSSPPPVTQRLIYEGRPLLDSNATLQQILRLDQRSSQRSSSPFVVHVVIRQDPPQTPTPQPAPVHRSVSGHIAAGPGNVPSSTHVDVEDAHDAVRAAMHTQAHMMQHAIAVQQAQMAAMMGQTQQVGQPFRAHTGVPGPVQANVPAAIASMNPEHGIPAQPEIREPLRPQNPSAPTQYQQHPHLPDSSPHADFQSSSRPPATTDAVSESTAPHIQRFVVQTGLMPLPPRIPTPAAQHPLMFLPMPSQSVPPTQTGQTMAWIVNSPVGPQGIVFAPGHGYFSTSSTISNRALQVPETQLLRPTPTVFEAQSHADSNHQTTRGEAHDGQLAHLPQAEHQLPVDVPGNRAAENAPPAQAAQQVAQAQQNDVLNLVIQRAWLFLRLYMFIFVLSESGTWRRTIMLGSAIFFCMLPRQNPLQDFFGAIRRHFDNLIGPPQLGIVNAQRNEQQQQQPPRVENDRARPTQTMPTPEEAARRLLAQQEQRNPNPILNALHTLERAVIMFLASLIPGVGERHVQAREEARRILDEQERRQREEQAAIATDDKSGNTRQSTEIAPPAPAPVPAASSSQTTAQASGSDADDRTALRQRNVE